MNRYWSYAEEPQEKNIIIENTLKYADQDEIKEMLENYGREDCMQVWIRTMLPDSRYRKMNFYLAKFIFNISLYDKEVSEFIQKNSLTRAERINAIFNK